MPLTRDSFCSSSREPLDVLVASGDIASHLLEVAAAAVGDYLGRSESFGIRLVLAIASAVNRRREQAAANEERDWHAEHEACQFDAYNG